MKYLYLLLFILPVISKSEDQKLEKMKVLLLQEKSALQEQRLNKPKPDSLASQDLVSVEMVEDRPYLYTYPPYPLPAKTQVTSKIYWQSNYEMTPDNISIIDINGNIVSSKSQIQINAINTYSGYLVWDCTHVPSGIYLIKISLGSNSRLIKVIKD